MATFAALKTAISTRLQDENNTAVSAAIVGQAVNEAISYWSNREFWFNEDLETITLMASNPVVPSVPSTLRSILNPGGMVIDYNGQKWPMSPVSTAEYDAQDDGAENMPDVYTYRAGQIEVFPIPDQAYTLNLRYLKGYADLSGDTDTNDFTNNAADLIKYTALGKLKGEFFEDEKMASYYNQRAADEYALLQRRTGRLRYTGRLTVETII